MRNVKPPRKCRVCGSNRVMFCYKDETTEAEITCVNCGLSIKKFGSDTNELVDIWHKLNFTSNEKPIPHAE